MEKSTDDKGRLMPTRFTLETTCGSIAPISGTSEDFDREIEEAMTDHADSVVGRLRCPSLTPTSPRDP